MGELLCGNLILLQTVPNGEREQKRNWKILAFARKMALRWFPRKIPCSSIWSGTKSVSSKTAQIEIANYSLLVKKLKGLPNAR